MIQRSARLTSRFTLEAIIGEGSQGRVYSARDEREGRAVAIKVTELDADPRSREDAMNDFEQEVRALATVDHPGVLKLLSRGISAYGDPYFVTELLRGVDLATALDRSGPLEVGALLVIGERIADALLAVHAAGFVHLDIKPQNLFLCDNGRAVILDFGLAAATAETNDERVRRASGTPQYMAPERLGADPPNARCDIYALGATFFHLLTGDTPIGAATPLFEALTALAAGRRQSVRGRGFPEPLTRLLEAMLTTSPRDRPSAASVRAQLSAMNEASSRAAFRRWLSRVQG